MSVDHGEILGMTSIGGYPKNTRDKMESFLQSVIIGDGMEKDTHGDKPSRSN